MNIAKNLLFAFLLIAVSGCGLKDLTPRQQAYDLGSKYEALQIIIEEVVSSGLTPESVRQRLKSFDKIATETVVNYVEAVRDGDADAQFYLQEGLRLIADITSYMIESGTIGSKPATSTSLSPAGFDYYAVMRV